MAAKMESARVLSREGNMCKCGGSGSFYWNLNPKLHQPIEQSQAHNTLKRLPMCKLLNILHFILGLLRDLYMYP